MGIKRTDSRLSIPIESRAAPTCLNPDPHNENIQDPILHYFGCIKISERENFFDSSNPLWAPDINYETIRLGDDRAGAILSIQERLDELSVISACKLSNIGILIKALIDDPETKDLVHNVEQSRVFWKRETDIKHDRVTPQRKESAVSGGEAGDSKPAGSAAQLPESESTSSNPTLVQHLETEQPDKHQETTHEFDLEEGSIVRVIRLREPTTDSEVAINIHLDEMSEHKVSVKRLLDPNQDSQISRSTDNSGYSLFHFSSNNEAWAEGAISKYFDEGPRQNAPRHKGILIKDRALSQGLLQPDLWSARKQEVSGMPQSRQLRPLCKLVKSDALNSSASNIVFFMPYLHWDTGYRYSKMAKTVDLEVTKQVGRELALREMRRLKRIESRKVAPFDKEDRRESRWDRPTMPRPRIHSQTATFRGIVAAANPRQARGLGWPHMKFDKFGRLLVINRLGQYLIDCARLYEAMECYKDNKLLQKYLMAEKAIHPRRTLDAAFFAPTIRNNVDRIKNQIVGRWSSPSFIDLHFFDSRSGIWPDHRDLERPCNICIDNIQKVPRLLMVDQLWMWILDGRTIITCFPKRFGIGNDPTGVYETIRHRLRDGESSKIRSIYELSLVIIEECCNNLFNTRQDRCEKEPRPQVHGAFLETISNLRQRQAVVCEKLQNFANTMTYSYRDFRPGQNGAGQYVTPSSVLSPNPEASIKGEIAGIISELEMMTSMHRTYERMIQQLVKNVQTVLKPTGHDVPEREEQLRSFLERAENVIMGIKERMDSFEQLKSAAAEVAERGSESLARKQHEIAVSEFFHSTAQADITMRQNTAIIMFTVVTIIFVPLSFMSSVFGMNAAEFSDDQWTLADELRYLFPISIAVTSVTIIVAFSEGVQSFFTAIWRLSTMSILVYTGIFHLWLKLKFSLSGWSPAGPADQMREAAVRQYLQSRAGRFRRNEERTERRGKIDAKEMPKDGRVPSGSDDLLHGAHESRDTALEGHSPRSPEARRRTSIRRWFRVDGSDRDLEVGKFSQD
ncbi:hypothetical protein GQ53DRAFT_848819 [Thozetella sp. PMI_491]|nr:hypothetical protein GQ53DRAFT_848819 [Thozetella sp. PMI_491]